MINMNDKEELKRRLQITTESLETIERRAEKLDDAVYKRQLSEHSAFNRLIWCIEAAVERTREEADND